MNTKGGFNQGRDPDFSVAIARSELHKGLFDCLRWGTAVERLPRMLIELIQTRLWEHLTRRDTGRTFGSLIEYVRHHAPDGLQARPEDIERYIKHDPLALAAWRRETKRNHGGDRGNQHIGGKPYNVSLAKKPLHGNSKSYI